jgi:hypothetical protein
MSNSRARILYEKQKSLMAELGIPFLDLWEAYYLSADRMLTGADGRHYTSALNMLMQSWFYRGEWSVFDGSRVAFGFWMLLAVPPPPRATIHNTVTAVWLIFFFIIFALSATILSSTW